ncbi:MAG TPA: PIN domain-containing protein [Vicinamibacterales bacterium]|nr:PIN domain-containing protein [Vicinamibacterales bacterium]
MLAVLDSNVLVAALRSRRGASFEVLQQLRAGRFTIAISVPLALEYEAVLIRHAEELGLARAEAVGLVDYLCAVAKRRHIHFLWRPTLADPRDEFVLELAVAAECDAIVTFNLRDFSGAQRFGIVVMTPAAFLQRMEKT